MHRDGSRPCLAADQSWALIHLNVLPILRQRDDQMIVPDRRVTIEAHGISASVVAVPGDDASRIRRSHRPTTHVPLGDRHGPGAIHWDWPARAGHGDQPTASPNRPEGHPARDDGWNSLVHESSCFLDGTPITD
jgi:hypothetical protein